MTPVQLTLDGIDTKKDASLLDFDSQSFKPILMAMRELWIGGECEIFVVGEAGSGKTHLLKAIYLESIAKGISTFLLSLSEILDTDVDVLVGLEQFALILIDDIHLLKQKRHWQEAIFHLINRARANSCQLVFSSNLPIGDLDLELLDLTTRLSQALSFIMPNGSDDDYRRTLLKSILRQKNWHLHPDVFELLVKVGPHQADDMTTVLNMLVGQLSYKNKSPLSKKTLNSIEQIIKKQSLLVELSDIDLGFDENDDNLQLSF